MAAFFVLIVRKANTDDDLDLDDDNDDDDADEVSKNNPKLTLNDDEEWLHAVC